MNVTSIAGSTSGTTKISVVPTLISGNSYKYKMAANPTTPEYGQECKSGYTAWDGNADIIATAGNKIVVVEVDKTNKCVGVGTAIIISAE